MPLIQLDFPNPLNTSVQIGDTAYFSNPIEYGTIGNPLSGDQWASTTTPHLTSNQSDIIKIGVITEIITWDGTVSSIICDMPQNLFNQYFSDIAAGGCIGDPNNLTYTGDCANFNPRIEHPAGELLDVFGLYSWGPTSIMTWYFDNPSVATGLDMFHFYQNASWIGFNGDPINHPFCAVLPGVKAVGASSLDDWSADTNHVNLWAAIDLIRLRPPGSTSSTPYVDFYNSSINDIINYLTDQGWPGYYSGMTWVDFASVGPHSVSSGQFEYVQLAFSPSNLHGSISFAGSEICTQGSFIMFSKDNKVNLSSVLGYYASVTLKNNSQEKIELFNVGADVFESSK